MCNHSKHNCTLPTDVVYSNRFNVNNLSNMNNDDHHDDHNHHHYHHHHHHHHHHHNQCEHHHDHHDRHRHHSNTKPGIVENIRLQPTHLEKICYHRFRIVKKKEKALFRVKWKNIDLEQTLDLQQILEHGKILKQYLQSLSARSRSTLLIRAKILRKFT